MKFLVASSNTHKLEEFNELFKQSSIELESSPEKLDVEETGETYIENAFIKAQAYYQKYKVPVMSDDSGLNVDILPNLLGVKSARFAPELATQKEKNIKLLELLKDQDYRKASFTAQLCFYISPQEIFYFEGVLNGEIATEASGESGFGYDPIFIAQDRSVSLAYDQVWKNEHSHRAKAVQAARVFFNAQGVK